MRTASYIVVFETLAWLRAVLVVVVAVLLMCGCGSLVPKEQAKSQSVQATESLAMEQEKTIRRVMEVGPQASRVAVKPGLAVPKDAAVVSVPMREDLTYTTTTRTGAGSASAAQGGQESSMPLGVKLSLIGVGIALIVAALTFAWRSVKGTALGQGIAAADEVLAGIIRSKRAQAQNSTDSQAIARAATEIADLEAERGRMASKIKMS